MIAVVLIAMVGMTLVVLSGSFRVTYQHVRVEADKAQARQLTASAMQWVRRHIEDIRDKDAKVLDLPLANPALGTVRVIRSSEGAAVTVEAVVHRGSRRTVHRRLLNLPSSP